MPRGASTAVAALIQEKQKSRRTAVTSHIRLPAYALIITDWPRRTLGLPRRYSPKLTSLAKSMGGGHDRYEPNHERAEGYGKDGHPDLMEENLVFRSIPVQKSACRPQ